MVANMNADQRVVNHFTRVRGDLISSDNVLDHRRIYPAELSSPACRRRTSPKEQPQ